MRLQTNYYLLLHSFFYCILKLKFSCSQINQDYDIVSSKKIKIETNKAVELIIATLFWSSQFSRFADHHKKTLLDIFFAWDE